MSLGIRKVLLIVLSIAGGIGLTLLTWLALNLVYDAGIDLARYTWTYTILTVLPLALFCAVWLDYFLDTNMLPSRPDAPAEE